MSVIERWVHRCERRAPRPRAFDAVLFEASATEGSAAHRIALEIARAFGFGFVAERIVDAIADDELPPTPGGWLALPLLDELGNVAAELLIGARVASAACDVLLGREVTFRTASALLPIELGLLEGLVHVALGRAGGDQFGSLCAGSCNALVHGAAPLSTPVPGLFWTVRLAGPGGVAAEGLVGLWLAAWPEEQPSPRRAIGAARAARLCGGARTTVDVAVDAALPLAVLGALAPGDRVIPDTPPLARLDGALAGTVTLVAGHTPLAVATLVPLDTGFRAEVQHGFLDTPVIERSPERRPSGEETDMDLVVTAHIVLARADFSIAELAELAPGSRFELGPIEEDRVGLVVCERTVATGLLVDTGDGRVAFEVREVLP